LKPVSWWLFSNIGTDEITAIFTLNGKFGPDLVSRLRRAVVIRKIRARRQSARENVQVQQAYEQ
jgi:hypothetical protein